MRKKRIGAIIAIFTGFIFFCGLGYLLGSTVNTTSTALTNPVTPATQVTSVPESKSSLITIDSIAVVNLDDGVTIQGQKTNYGAQMLEYTSDKFLVTGLEDARQGIQNGKYASYIIIPSTFSESVVSINGAPKKAVLEYAMNNQLTGETVKNISFEISNFEKLVNDNLGYMYIYSILGEFHNAQDNAGKVMSNDKRDLEVLQSINSVDLVELVSTPDITLPISEIENVNVSGNFLTNQQIIDDIWGQYKYALSSSADDFMLIKEEAIDMTDNLRDSEDIISDIDVETNSHGTIVYKEGIDNIESYIEGYNEDLESSRDESIRLITEIRDTGTKMALESAMTLFDQKINDINGHALEYQENFINELKAILEREFPEEPEGLVEPVETIEPYLDFNYNLIYDIATDYINDCELDSYMAEIEPIIEEEMSRIWDLKADIMREQINEEMDHLWESKIKTLSEQIYKILNQYNIIYPADLLVIDLSEVTDGQEENYKNVLLKLENLSIVDQDEISDTIENKILDPIREQADYIKESLLDDYSLRLNDAKNLNDSMDYYQPSTYIDGDKVNLLITNMYQNHKGLETSVETQNLQYSNYISDLYRNAHDGVSNVSQTIVQANEVSKEKVTQGLAGAKISRKTSSEVNQALLQDFTSQLGYTRIGSMEYKQVYEFIVNPLNLSDLSALADNTKTQSMQVSSPQSLAAAGGQSPVIYYLLGGVLILLIIFVINRMAQLFKNTSKEEQQ